MRYVGNNKSFFLFFWKFLLYSEQTFIIYNHIYHAGVFVHLYILIYRTSMTIYTVRLFYLHIVTIHTCKEYYAFDKRDDLSN